MKSILLSFLAFLFGLEYVKALSCLPCDNPEEICGKPPSCCKSGYYTKDVCGCCKVCAKAENEVCGGPWGTSGNCSPGTRCLRSCECKTVKDNTCVFPFKYKGKTYNQCTKDESVNGMPWCATRVDRSGNVLNGKWEDCEEGCPGTSYDSCFGDLFNANGKCINERRAITLERKIKSGSQTILLDRAPSDQEKAPGCSLIFN